MIRRAFACALAVVLGCLLLFACGGDEAPVGAETPLDGSTVDPLADLHLDKTPPQKTSGLVLRRIGWTYDCMECHRSIKARWHHEPLQGEHRKLALEHGANRFCLNCHHPENRNAFVDYDGSEIAQKDADLLCAKCHGPIHRDWRMGMHGRRNGFWDPEIGKQTRLHCIQCHDPHRPAFGSIKPLSAPGYPPRAAGQKAAHDHLTHEEGGSKAQDVSHAEGEQ